MSANGRVLIGFSNPYVAKYDAAGTYSAGMVLARGVSVSIQPEITEAKEFCADNGVAESTPGKFKKAALKLVVDGMLPTAEKFIYGLGEPEAVTYGGEQTVQVTKYGDSEPPMVGIGYVAAYRSDGVESYEPVILTKSQFKMGSTEAHTMENGEINYQTQELEATSYRDDKGKWKWVGETKPTQQEAAAVIAGIFGIA